MKIIVKVVEYLEDTQQIIVKFCRKNAPKSIDEYPAGAIDVNRLETVYDSQCLIESIMKIGYPTITKQEVNETPIDGQCRYCYNRGNRPTRLCWKSIWIWFKCYGW